MSAFDYLPMPAWFKLVKAQVRFAMDEGLIFTLTGAPGSGRTSFCRELAKLHSGGKYSATYCRLSGGDDPVALLRDIFIDLGGDCQKQKLLGEKRLKPSLKVVADWITSRRVRLLLLDQVDHLGDNALGAIFELMDILRHDGARTGLVMTGDCPVKTWAFRPDPAKDHQLNLGLVRSLDWTGGTNERVHLLRGHHHIQPLTPKECGAVLFKWCPSAALFGEPLAQNRPEAVRLAAKVAAIVSGNFAALRQFAFRINQLDPGVEFTSSIVTELAGAMIAPTVFKSFLTRGVGQQEFDFDEVLPLAA